LPGLRGRKDPDGVRAHAICGVAAVENALVLIGQGLVALPFRVLLYPAYRGVTMSFIGF
jgi:hypothetical protein